MTPKERVESLLRGEKADKIPFTIYETKLPACSVERRLRNEGLCLVKRISVVKTSSPNVSTETRSYSENGIQYSRTTIRTPFGELYSVNRPAGFTSWCVSRVFKGPEDYKKLMFTVKDQVFEPDYESFMKNEKAAGGDVIQRAGIGASPLHQIMISWMGIEAFSIEWSERRDEIEKLYSAMVENLRKIYPLVARSPALHANLGGNETGPVMGRERFARYVVPLYNEAAEVFHKHGKYIGAHLDGNNRVWADMVGNSLLDYVEAFSPSPDTDMTLSEAFDAWRGKLLWINFPSSVHLAGIPEIEETAERIARDSMPDRRLIIGITEDIPEDRWQENLLAISRVINRFPVTKKMEAIKH